MVNSGFTTSQHLGDIFRVITTIAPWAALTRGISFGTRLWNFPTATKVEYIVRSKLLPSPSSTVIKGVKCLGNSVIGMVRCHFLDYLNHVSVACLTCREA